MKESVLRNVLNYKNYLSVHRNSIRILGATPAILLCEFIAWENYLIEQNKIEPNNKFFCKQEYIQEKLGISKKVQIKAMMKLKEMNLITIEKKGMPCKNFYKLEYEQIEKVVSGELLYSPKGNTGIAQKDIQESPKGQNIYNINRTKNKQKENSISVSKETQDTFKLNKKILEIIKNCLLKKSFKKVMFPEDYKDKKYITNTLKNIHKYLLALKNNNYHLYALDKKWIIDNNIRCENINTYAKLGRLLNKSICRYNKMQTNDNYWPPKKENLTKDLSSFIYNPITRKSWFLYCLSNEPILLKSSIDKTNAKKIMQSIPEHIREYSFQLLRFGWDELRFWKAIKSMYDWYEENTVKLREFNYSIDQDCGCSYKAVVGTFKRLLSLYHTYTGTWQIFNIGSFGMDNKVWPLFLEWAWKTEQVSLDFVPKKNPEYETDVADVYNQDVEVVL